ncbi:MAG: Trk system potassium transporter TrkA [Clostridia bacterium]|nr:Trk system potassium transporter TrkA [Clostridia bacterium]
MNIIIVGIGKIGETLVQDFVKENCNVTIIDTNENIVNSLVNKYDIKGVIGSGCEREVLENCEVSNADFFIASTSHDELNILCCVLAKNLGAKNTIARVRAPEYYSEIDNLKETLKLDLVFNPELEIAEEIQKILKFPSAVMVETFAKGKIILAEYNVTKNNPIVNSSIMEIIKKFKLKVLFALVKRGGKTFIPKGDFVIEEEDNIFIIAPEKEIANFTKKLNIYKQKARSVFIIGGGKVAYYLADILSKDEVSVKLIEKNAQRCEILSEELPNVTILQGDATDHNVLEEEDVSLSDAIVSLMGVDEENIVLSLFARSICNNKIITRIDKPALLDIAEKIGLDTVLSPRIAISNHILKYVRGKLGDHTSMVKSLYKIDEEIEALEFSINETFTKTNIPIKDLHIKEEVLIGGIFRNNEFILPKGDTCLSIGDRVIIVAKEQILELSKIFN